MECHRCWMNEMWKWHRKWLTDLLLNAFSISLGTEQTLYSFTWYLILAILTRYPFNLSPKWKNVVRTSLYRSVSAAIRGPTKQFWFTINAQLLRIQIESEALFPIFVHSVPFRSGMELMLFNTLFSTVSPDWCVWRLSAAFPARTGIWRQNGIVSVILQWIFQHWPPSFKWILRTLHWKSGNKCYSSNFVKS